MAGIVRKPLVDIPTSHREAVGTAIASGTLDIMPSASVEIG